MSQYSSRVVAVSCRKENSEFREWAVEWRSRSRREPAVAASEYVPAGE
jgi:hypothetical protein